MSQCKSYVSEIIPQEQLDKAVKAALSCFAETQRILALPYMTTEEVAKVYPIGKSTLDKLRAKREGPTFIQTGERGAAMYTHEDIRRWLNRHRQKVL